MQHRPGNPNTGADNAARSATVRSEAQWPSTGSHAADTRSDAQSSGHGTNVSQTERLVTGVGGALLALSGLRRGGLSGVLGLVAGGALVARAATGHCPLYARMAPTERERRIAEQRGWETAAVNRESVFIARPREQLYGFWREFSNLSKVMSHVERVDVIDARRSRWLVSLPLGKELHWKSTVTEDRPNERIAWKADDDADVPNSGWVEFRDAGARGTEVIVQIAYEPPGGELGRSLVRLWPASPGALLKNDLQQFKRRVESGEIGLQGSGRGTSPTAATPQGPSAQHH
jgi:uncharacterized membrane protein